MNDDFDNSYDDKMALKTILKAERESSLKTYCKVCGKPFKAVCEGIDICSGKCYDQHLRTLEMVSRWERR